ncbi:MAG: translin family protein [Candidatus Hadarchaeaceae archaeon]
MLERMRAYFDHQAELREQALEASRLTIRASAKAIAAIHRGDQRAADDFIAEAREGLNSLAKLVADTPELAESGVVLSAQQEYGEAKIVRAAITEKKLAEIDEIGIPYRPYLAALADAAGELRRHVLDLIRANEIERAEIMLKMMEVIFEFLMEFDYADAVLPGMRRRQDMVRQVLERTRGDLTLALRQQRLERALEKRGG